MSCVDRMCGAPDCPTCHPEWQGEVRDRWPVGLAVASLDYTDKAYGIGYDCDAELEPDTQPREPGCLCQWEIGDSPCPVHPSLDDDGYAEDADDARREDAYLDELEWRAESREEKLREEIDP